jgi:hypothetical protein
VAILLVLALIAGCSRIDYGSKVYSFDELLEKQEAVSGKYIKLSAFMEEQRFCTQDACKNPCCNNCSSIIYLKDSQSSKVRVKTTLHCDGGICGYSCPYPIGASSLIKGKLSSTGTGIYYFEVTELGSK